MLSKKNTSLLSLEEFANFLRNAIGEQCSRILVWT